MIGGLRDGFISICLSFYKEVLVVPIELLFYLGVFFDQVTLFIFHMGYSVDVLSVYHGSVEEFCVLFPLFETLYPGLLPP